ncbi:MAG: hypothetical protein HOP12_10500 [Candidatus Eisenbacteria bacterium]|uniref:T9SS type A sorting domain-containing protein n=1 Tax=Eiseniibacteriota bacterium TaxID=2212470 RepID=A0A849SNZ5_UNCEI|nr:hypothetical protein [Candidatus Eisenbacteria bacterium]
MRTISQSFTQLAAAGLSLAFIATSAHAWTSIKAVKTATGGIVNDVQVVADGTGGTYTCWSDNRNANFDVFVQHLDAAGAVMPGWSATGNAVATQPGDQVLPRMALGLSGGVIVTWEDGRLSNNTDIYAARLTRTGVLEWTSQVCNTTGDQRAPLIVSDMAGGAVISWWNQPLQVFTAQRLNSAGGKVWLSIGVTPSTAGNQFHQDLVSDGAGGALIAINSGWLRVHQLSGSNGDPAWVPADGTLIVADNSPFPSLAADGLGGAYVAYSYTASAGNINIAASHVSSSGQLMSSMVLCAAPFHQVVPKVVCDGEGAIVAWNDYRRNLGSATDWYAARIKPDPINPPADVLDSCNWPTDGLIVMKDLTTDQEIVTNMVSDGHGGAVLAAQTSVTSDILARRIRREGLRDSSSLLASGAVVQSRPSIARVAAGKTVTVWREGSNAINAQELTFVQDPAGPSLTVSTGFRSVRLDWVGPGNDPVLGAVQSFEARYASAPITDANFSAAALMGSMVVSGPPGTPYCASVVTPVCGLYYFAVRSIYAVCSGPSLLRTLSANAKCSGTSAVVCEFAARSPTPIDDGPSIDTQARELELATPRPNPSAERATLSFSIPSTLQGKPYELAVFDLTGRRIQLVDKGVATAGRFSMDWNLRGDHGRRVSAGVYYVRLVVGVEMRKQSMMVLD